MLDIGFHDGLKHIPLMHVNCDQSLVLLPLHLLQVLGGLTDQQVEHVKELGVGVTHDLLVHPTAAKSILSVPRPDHLDSQDANLCLELVHHLQKSKLVVVDIVEALPGITHQVNPCYLKSHLMIQWTASLAQRSRLLIHISTLPSARTWTCKRT